MNETTLYLILLAVLGGNLFVTIVVVARQATALDRAHRINWRLRGRLRARREHCEQMHLAELDALVEATRPAPTLPPVALLSLGAGIHPRPIRRNRSHWCPPSIST